jgi:hypothetical protein
MQQSSEADLEELKPGFTAQFTWEDFGTCSADNINDLEKEWFPNDTTRRIQLHGIWTRHPLRQRQGKVM